LVEFLLIIENLINYSKKDIDLGNTPSEIYKICSCIREAFCISYSIRKENNFFLYFKNENLLVKLVGKELKYLGPDERSQAILLRKALDKVNLINNEEWVRSTPGIFISRFKNFQSFILYLKSLINNQIALIFNSISPLELTFLAHTYDFPKIKKFKHLEEQSEYFFIIASNPSNKAPLIEFLRILAQNFPLMIEKTVLIPLKKIKAPEDKILYINFQIDQQEKIGRLI